MKLRDYQEVCRDISIDYIKSKSQKKPLIVAPVGTGKSLIIGATANGIPNPICVIQPNKELLEQNHQKYEMYGSEASIFSASLKQKNIGHVTFATPKSICNQPSLLHKDTVFMIDEAHMQSNPSGILGTMLKTHFPKNKKIGFTATPVILDQNMELGPHLKMVNRARKSLWNELLHIVQIKDIYKDFWCPLDYESIGMNESELQWNVSKSEFTDSSMKEFYDDNNIEDLILERIETLDKRNCLIFCPSIEQAISLSLRIPESRVVTGSTPLKEREQIVADFRAGKIKFLINVLVFTVGTDFPNLECIIDATPTGSVTRWYQKLGRIVRLNPLDSTKRGLIIDFCNACKRFGKIENITFENDSVFGWAMFSNKKLITGIPISSIGEFMQGGVQGQMNKEFKLTFGRFAGKPLKEVPESYIKWLKGGDFNLDGNLLLKQALGV